MSAPANRPQEIMDFEPMMHELNDAASVAAHMAEDILGEIFRLDALSASQRRGIELVLHAVYETRRRAGGALQGILATIEHR